MNRPVPPKCGLRTRRRHKSDLETGSAVTLTIGVTVVLPAVQINCGPGLYQRAMVSHFKARLAKTSRSSRGGSTLRECRAHTSKGSFLGLSSSLTSLSGVSLDAPGHRCLANSLNGDLASVRFHSLMC